ncbi:MAG TPA: SRPBCC family protein [Chloroflexota bacterium]|nr:SRPBCC family protein [Chloroflexota bacterium]
MLNVSESAVVAGPPGVVFAAAADPEMQLRWDPGTLKRVEKLTAGPLGPGARYRGVFAGMGTVEYEFAEYKPGRRFAHRARIPMGEMRHIFTFEPTSGGTRVTQEGELRPNVLGWVLQPVMRGMLRKRFRTIAAELNQYLATAPSGGPTGEVPR